MHTPSTPRVLISVEGRKVAWAWGDTLFVALMGAGLPVQSACSGHGACGLCVVHLSGAPLPEPTEREARLLGDAQLSRGVRLACCVRQPAPFDVRMGTGPHRTACSVDSP